MKTSILAAIVLLSFGTAQAAELTDQHVEYCVSLKEVADVVTEQKNKGVSKSTMYATAAKTPAQSQNIKDTFYMVTGFVFKGLTPDQIFDICIDVAAEDNKKKPAKKSGYVAL